MTVTKYYFTFGFLVKKQAYLEHFGYTLDNLPEEYQYDRPDEEVTEEDAKEAAEESMFEWINDDHFGGKQVEVDGVNYIVRFFTHDNELSEDYVVVGIDHGSMDKFSGSFTPGTNCTPQDRIRTLTRNEDWIKMIQDSDKYSYTGSGDVDYGVPDPGYSSLYRIPTVHITTDDCECCS